jgi:hypothetical protein
MKSFQFAWLALMRMTQQQYLDYLARHGGFSAPLTKSQLSERDLHDAILNTCRARGFYPVHSRMDKPTTTALGTPDLIIALPNGKTLWIECKVGKAKLTPEQNARLAFLHHLGHEAHVVRSPEEFSKLCETIQTL